MEELLKNLKERNLDGVFVKTEQEGAMQILAWVQEYERETKKAKKDVVVSFGGSQTIDALGVKELLIKEGYTLLNPYASPDREEQNRQKKRAMLADIFLMSTNALTKSGELINIDGNGNRLAPMIFGPERVLFAVGVNKIVENEAQGLARVKKIACPKNAQRLRKNTPCALTGVCQNCLINGETICSHTVVTRRFGTVGRGKIVIIDKNLGF